MIVSKKGVRRRLRKAGFKHYPWSEDWRLDLRDSIIIVPECLFPEAASFPFEEVKIFRLDKQACDDILNYRFHHSGALILDESPNPDFKIDFEMNEV